MNSMKKTIFKFFIALIFPFLGVLLLNAQVVSETQPGTTAGDVGTITFKYGGVDVAYTTVRAKDGKIWLQQNLGSTRVATVYTDALSYGDLYNWGRWDDGHHFRDNAKINMVTVDTAVPTPNNPTILDGTNPFYWSATGSKWWWSNGKDTDKAEAASPAEVTATNGCDPCKKLMGENWRMPTIAEWEAVRSAEVITGQASAFSSTLKIPSMTLRAVQTGVINTNTNTTRIWSSTAGASGGAYVLHFTNIASSASTSANVARGSGFPIRCIRENVILTATTADGLMGTASGVTTVSKGSPATVTATANTGYHFINWTLATSGGAEQSTSPSYTFNATSDKTLVANFASNTVNLSNTANSDASMLNNCNNCDVTVSSGGSLNVNTAKAFNSLTVAPGAKLTLNENMTLTVGTLTLESGSTGTATLVDNTLTTPQAVMATVQQYLPQGRNWYVGTPVVTNNTTNVAGNLTVTNAATSVSYWDETIGDWVNNYTGELTPGLGYIAVSNAGSSTNNVSFTGPLNTGNITVTLTRKSTAPTTYAGYNLVANPYPSYLDAMAAINANNNIEKTIWYRTRSTEENVALRKYYFETVNTSSGEGTNTSGTGIVTGYIPPMQAFWVRTSLHNQSLVFTNAMRHHKGNVSVGEGTVPTTVMKAPKQSLRQLVRLNVSNGIANDEAIIYFDSNANDALDAYDSQKRSNNDVAIPEIYTLVESKKLVINGMNTIPENVEIPLGFTPGTSTSFSIKAAEIRNFQHGTQILLKDDGTGNIQDLSDLSTYSFDNSVPSNGRFSLIFKSPSVPTALNSADNEDSRLMVFRNANNQIVLNCKNIVSDSKVSIFNSMGQKIVTKKLIDTVTIIDTHLEPGVYFVTVNNGITNKTRKVILN